MARTIVACALAFVLPIASPSSQAQTRPLECANWNTQHPQWLWCDDFESDASLEQNYFEVSRVNGRFGVSTDTAYAGAGSLKGSYLAGDPSAGGLKLSIGRNPANYNGRGRLPDRDFSEVYWRFYMKTSSNWIQNGQKLTRATVFTAPNWSQAAIGHVWEDSPTGLGLALDPASGVVGSNVVTTGYNDFEHLRWLGLRKGIVQVYAPENRNRWFCMEVRMKLNTPGQADGVFAFWIDGNLQAETRTLDWRGSYTGYGINTVMLENFLTQGAPQTQQRYMDNFVVSTAPIGCYGNEVRPNPPTDLRVQPSS